MLHLIKKHQAAVICSVIASLLGVYFIEPILSGLGRAFLSVASFLGTVFVDRVFAEAAHLETANYAFALVMIYIIIPFLLLCVSLLFVGYRIAAGPRATSDDVEGTNSIDARELKLDNVTRSPSIKIAKGGGLIVFGSILFISTLLVTGAQYVQLGIISSFKQHIRILSPYIDDDTEDKLVSDWSRMSTKTEYDLICAQLENLAEKNQIELPENRLYVGSTP